MSGTLKVKDVDDLLIVKLKERAAAHGRSTEAEHREILREALDENKTSFEELAAELRKLTMGRRQTPAEALLRESRDER